MTFSHISRAKRKKKVIKKLQLSDQIQRMLFGLERSYRWKEKRQQLVLPAALFMVIGFHSFVQL